MIVYWLLFAFFAAGALLQSSPAADKPQKVNISLFVAGILTALLVGFRYDVGADWDNYENLFRAAGRRDFADALRIGDPGYQALNWLVYQLDIEIWLVNAVCALLFAWGLFRLCRTQPLPWAAALVAVPYMVIVVAMGYSRQAAALGLIMAGIPTFLRVSSSLRFVKYAAAAALFHKTAVIGFPLIALASIRNRLTNFLVVTAISVWLYDFFLSDAVGTLVRNYIEARYSSQGAAIRVAMNLAAAIVFWAFRRRLQYSDLERRVWRNFSLAAVAAVVLLIALPSSTAVDRLALYITPLQVVVLGRIPLLFASRVEGVVALILYAFAVQYVWLTYAKHAQYWVPYQFFPI